jgi:hypothetical protein
MWTYPRPSCSDCPSSKELSVVEVEAQIHKVLDLGVILTPPVLTIPLRRGMASVRVWSGMPDHIVMLGLLQSLLYKDRKVCTTVRYGWIFLI